MVTDCVEILKIKKLNPSLTETVDVENLGNIYIRTISLGIKHLKRGVFERSLYPFVQRQYAGVYRLCDGRLYNESIIW